MKFKPKPKKSKQSKKIKRHTIDVSTQTIALLKRYQKLDGGTYNEIIYSCVEECINRIEEEEMEDELR